MSIYVYYTDVIICNCFDLLAVSNNIETWTENIPENGELFEL